MKNKKREKYGTTNKATNNRHQSEVRTRNRGFSTSIKLLLAISIIAVIAIAWVFLIQPTQSSQPGPGTTSYPHNIAGVSFTTPTIASSGTKAVLPASFVSESKLVFVDLKLEEQTNEITYQGRTIPLSIYRNGEYLPLVIISTPQQKTIAGIRVCEPCGSFSFHIKEGKYLECDSCGTRWNVETLEGVSGGCTQYPPPQLSATVGDNIEIDLSPLQLKVSAS